MTSQSQAPGQPDAEALTGLPVDGQKKEGCGPSAVTDVLSGLGKLLASHLP
jgi:hypothetical protein